MQKIKILLEDKILPLDKVRTELQEISNLFEDDYVLKNICNDGFVQTSEYHFQYNGLDYTNYIKNRLGKMPVNLSFQFEKIENSKIVERSNTVLMGEQIKSLLDEDKPLEITFNFETIIHRNFQCTKIKWEINFKIVKCEISDEIHLVITYFEKRSFDSNKKSKKEINTRTSYTEKAIKYSTHYSDIV